MNIFTKFPAILMIGIPLLFVSCGKETEPDKPVIPDAVDLGLSVKWASFDVGATKPGEFGTYFAWGETETKSGYFWKNYALCNGSRTSITKYNSNEDFGHPVDNLHTLKPEDDVAHLQYGGRWRMPTAAEIKELIECPFLVLSLETVGHVTCLKITSEKTGNSILFPPGGTSSGAWGVLGDTSGRFWTSEIDPSPSSPNHPAFAITLQTTSVIEDHISSLSLEHVERHIGLNVRAVCQ